MYYVLIEWANPVDDDDPEMIYAELDETRRENRRVEFYPSGVCFSYGEERGHREALNPDPYPEDLRALNISGVRQAHSIPARLFYEIWNQVQERPDGFMGIIW